MDWSLVLNVAIGSFLGVWSLISIATFFAFLGTYFKDLREDHSFLNVIEGTVSLIVVSVLAPFFHTYHVIHG